MVWAHWRNTGAKRARMMREEFGLDEVAPLACLLDVVEERAGMAVVVGRLTAGVFGACTNLGGQRIAWVETEQAVVRKRFTLAHELGHLRLDHDGALIVDTLQTLYGQTTQREVEANAFAAELLIPKAVVQELGPEPDLEALARLAARFGTSASTALYRFTACKLVSPERKVELEALIEEREHLAEHQRLGLPDLDDRLASLTDRGPYVSPGLHDTQLGAALRGEAAMEPELAVAVSGLLARA